VSAGGRAERRLVTILFADLVAFTALSEHRDPEAVRDMLEQYFERCRTIIVRYGGVVEKFIGDAVMAVWGSPVAREDDAERAVRAGLDLVLSVSELAESLSMDELRVRAGVLTGETAVKVGAEHQGMVIGDAVNTASRIQTLAEPSTVLVDEGTRRATHRAIAYEDGGLRPVKGREQQVRVFRALRVLGGAGGARRSPGFEAPFVGRDRELRTLMACGERVRAERRAERVVVIGEAGMGKSRLAWEYEKHADGIAERLLWHRGRSLSYGEGVSYWALAEIVRMRARIAEGEAAAGAREKLRDTVEQYVTDERERRLVLPRLEHLLGLLESGGPPEDLFSGWRLFLERLAAAHPVVIVLEDLQWADTGLLSFVDHLVEWSSDAPILIVALARPEVLERRPEWAAGAIRLQPLSDDAMSKLLRGLIPGLPASALELIRGRAGGIPLYAVETVRMLLDRGVLVADGDGYAVNGEIGEIEVPETLHALIASRLDGLPAAERALVQDASVLGETFPVTALAGLTGLAPAEIGTLLSQLAAKQILAENRDRNHPEHGHFGFVQTLLRTVAYGTLGRHDRKARHLRAVELFDGELHGEEQAEILATHLEAAIEADPAAADVGSLRLRASDTLAEAGRRAFSLGLGIEARRWFERAAALAGDERRQAELLDLAGQSAALAGQTDAQEPFDRAAELLEALGERRRALVVRARSAETLFHAQRFSELADTLEVILGELGSDPVDGDVAYVASLLARARINTARAADGLAALDLALSHAERVGDVPLLADLLVTRGTVLGISGHAQEGIALLRHGLELATARDIFRPAIRATANLALAATRRSDHPQAIALSESTVTLAGRSGDRGAAAAGYGSRVPALYALGRWDELIESAPQMGDWAAGVRCFLILVHHARGEHAAAVEQSAQSVAESAGADPGGWVGVGHAVAVAANALGHGDAPAALDAIAPSVPAGLQHGVSLAPFDLMFDAAVVTGRVELGEQTVGHLLAAGDPWAAPARDALIARFRGRVASLRGEHEAAQAELDRAVGWARESGEPFLLGRCLLELANQRIARGQPDDAPHGLLIEARARFAELGAVPWSDRAERALEGASTHA
jgi:class 3 adenylate cyclase/tetratricopeptide (TPR) repeat protein